MVGRSEIVWTYDETRDPLLVLRTRLHANFYTHSPVSRLSTAVPEHTLVGSGCDRRFLLKDQDDYITPVDQGFNMRRHQRFLDCNMFALRGNSKIECVKRFAPWFGIAEFSTWKLE
jgi:hypothetical protein